MATLLSPGTAVDVTDNSFFIPGRAATIPLLFIATADQKTQSDGTTPALGTYESGVVRTVTSRQQAAALYGSPVFKTDASGNPLHGDARNEYGLDALFKFLEIGNVAYVVRANVNLNDSYTDIKSLWTSKISDAANTLNGAIATAIQEFNDANGLIPASATYKQTVTASELKALIDVALVDALKCYSFSSSKFQTDYILDHTVDMAGIAEVLYDDTSGNITGLDATGLSNDTTIYGFEISIVDNGGTNTFVVQILGNTAQTFAELISEMESKIQAVTGDAGTVVDIVNGRIRITSGLSGATSRIEILTDGPSSTTPLFASTNLFSAIDTPSNGVGPNPLDIYNDAFTIVTGAFDGVDSDIDGWTAGSIAATEFTPSEGEGLLIATASDYDNTLEFKNNVMLGANDAARRAAIVTSIQAAITDPNRVFTSEKFSYNLVIAPGYWEATNELAALSTTLQNEVFVIADTPFDRAPFGPNGITEWADDNKVFSSYCAYYYVHGLTSNVDGVTIMTTAASSALKIYAISDRDTALWYAPAGPKRGLAPDIESLGYVSGVLGTAVTWVENDIDVGTRDLLFAKDINYFTNIPNVGPLLMSQNTSQTGSSKLDRVNVARLVCHIRRTLRQRLFTFLFDPNDTQTHENIKAVADSFLGQLLGRRALFDYATSLDTIQTVNNTAVLDVAIKPVDSLEFLIVELEIVSSSASIR